MGMAWIINSGKKLAILLKFGFKIVDYDPASPSVWASRN